MSTNPIPVGQSVGRSLAQGRSLFFFQGVKVLTFVCAPAVQSQLLNLFHVFYCSPDSDYDSCLHYDRKAWHIIQTRNWRLINLYVHHHTMVFPGRKKMYFCVQCVNCSLSICAFLLVINMLVVTCIVRLGKWRLLPLSLSHCNTQSSGGRPNKRHHG